MKDIIYARSKRDNKIVSIDDIPIEMSGLACMCKCVQCGADLQACSLEEKKVAKYFRHHSDKISSDRGTSNCSSKKANEKALHEMAEQIIQEEKKVYVPCRTISLNEAGIEDIPEVVARQVGEFKLYAGGCVEAESVHLEKQLPGFKPDAFLRTKRGELLVEFFVSHKVDEEKKEKVAQYGSAMIEIDLREWMEKPISSEELRSFITRENKNRKWIYYPLTENAKVQARNYYEKHEKVIKFRKDEAERIEREKREEEERKVKEERRLRNIEIGNEKIKELFNPQNYSAALNSLRDDDSFLSFYRDNCQAHWYSFAKDYQDTGEIPFFIDIPITGEMIFKCDRRIWQSVIFNRYIYGRKDNSARFCVSKIFDKLKEEHKISTDYQLVYKLENPLYPDVECSECTIHLPQRVVESYITYLEKLGFVNDTVDGYSSEDNNWKVVKAIKTVEPPNQEYAHRLIKALREVDKKSAAIDSLIEDHINEQEINEMLRQRDEKTRKEESRKKDKVLVLNQGKERNLYRGAKMKQEEAKVQRDTSKVVETISEDEPKEVNKRFQCRCCKADFKLGSLMYYTSKTGEKIKVCIGCYYNPERIERIIKEPAHQQAKQQKECEQFSMFGKQY